MMGVHVAELKEAHLNQHALINSHSWRLTLPLREIKLWLLSPRQQAKRYLSAVLRISKENTKKWAYTCLSMVVNWGEEITVKTFIFPISSYNFDN